jgi:hypothetical protein
MGDIKRQISSIIDLKRGSVNVNYVYRATTLVWERGGPVTPTLWLTSGLKVNLGINNPNNNYVTSGLNINFK